MNKTIAAFVAEFVGAAALMFVGGGAILNGLDLVAVALAHGLILSVCVTATMHISGGQFNPAVSVGLALIKKQSWATAAVLIVAQLAGAVVAAVALKSVFAPDVVAAKQLGATLGSLSKGDSASMGMVVLLEAIATFLLMFCIMGTAVDPRGVGKTAAVGGFGIGLTVAADILCFGPLTGASMNPSRSFAPALVGGYWDMHAAYWIGPIVGAAAAAVLWKTVIEKSEERA
ncbi:MAG TPA: aquaporin [Phycisphaerales bacterium]|nr:aquaporin [Phycisphaerales bacterium]